MQINIDAQILVEDVIGIPSLEEMNAWAQAAFDTVGYKKDCALTVRFVTNDEIQELNREYRDKDKPTNILSFPFNETDLSDLPLEAQAELQGELGGEFLGDLVIATEVVRKEAHEQKKTLTEHYAHLLIHGCLHLLGFDHIEDDEAEEMEGHEIVALEKLGYPNPYEVDDTIIDE